MGSHSWERFKIGPLLARTKLISVGRNRTLNSWLLLLVHRPRQSR